MRHGHGVCLYNGGAIYEGEWAQGVRQGRGTCRYPFTVAPRFSVTHPPAAAAAAAAVAKGGKMVEANMVEETAGAMVAAAAVAAAVAANGGAMVGSAAVADTAGAPSFYLPTCPPDFPSYLPTYLPTHTPIYALTYLPTYLSPTDPPTHLPTFLPNYHYLPLTCLPAYQPTHLPTYLLPTVSRQGTAQGQGPASVGMGETGGRRVAPDLELDGEAPPAEETCAVYEVSLTDTNHRSIFYL